MAPCGKSRYSRENRNSERYVTHLKYWIPIFMGMTNKLFLNLLQEARYKLNF